MEIRSTAQGWFTTVSERWADRAMAGSGSCSCRHYGVCCSCTSEVKKPRLNDALVAQRHTKEESVTSETCGWSENVSGESGLWKGA